MMISPFVFSSIRESIDSRADQAKQATNDQQLEIVFGLLTREAAIGKVRDAVSTIDVFVEILEDRVGNVPKVVLCNFSSRATIMAALKTHKSIQSMHYG